MYLIDNVEEFKNHAYERIQTISHTSREDFSVHQAKISQLTYSFQAAFVRALKWLQLDSLTVGLPTHIPLSTCPSVGTGNFVRL